MSVLINRTSIFCFFIFLFSSPLFATTDTQLEKTMPTFEIINNSITQSPNDKREYQVIKLSNQLEVLLISDPDLDNSAASLSVPVGSMHNPDSQLGLAHYLEHMLFLGSERYPTINEYSKFMSQNGGYTNAYTAQESTVYGFEVNDNAFDEALDRLADVMAQPLLDEKYAEKERHTVNAEHKTYFDNDMRKLYSLMRYSLNPKHPMARFSTGDLTTLIDKPGSKLQDELKLFFDTYYSANLMKVALTSPRTISELQQLASLYLNQIENKEAAKPVTLQPMFTDKQLSIKVEMKPTADIKLLQVNFLVPSLKDEYMYKAGGYITRLLGSDHQGGLSDYLQKEGLAESVMSGFYATYSEQYSQFSMQFKLTNKGVDAQDRIMASLFSFIELIKKEGVNQSQYEQKKKSLDRSFEFLKKNAGFNYVMGLSASMQLYPTTDLLFYPYRLDTFSEKLISQLLTYMTPQNSRLFVLSPDAQGGTQIPYYQGEYALTNIPQAEQQVWLTEASKISLTLPRDNEWLAEDLSLVKQEQNNRVKQLINKEGHSVWFGQSAHLDEPKATLKLQLNSDSADQSAKSRVLMSLLLQMLGKEFAELNFVTQEAGIGFSLSNSNGLLISTSGYSDKQALLLLTILKEMKEVEFSELSLSLAKQESQRRLSNKTKIKAMDLALDGFRKVIRQPAWSDQSLLAEIEEITLQDINTFIEQLFEKSTLRLLALGNFSSTQVLQLSRELEKVITVNKKPFYKIKRLNAEPEKGAINYQLKSEMQDDALASIYLTSMKGDKALATAELLNKILRPAFYDQIRTQEQLTYSPFTASLSVNDSVLFGLFTQTPAVSNAQLYLRFNAFLEKFETVLKATTEKQFTEIKEAHISNYLAKPTSLAQEFSYLTDQWLDIKEEINNKQGYIESLQSVSLIDLNNFYNTVFKEGKSRQEILIQVQGEKFKSEPLLKVQGENTFTLEK